MPLPEGGKTAWPPTDLAPYVNQARAAAAWWSGDIATLKTTADAGGTTGRRRFWQRRATNDATKATAHLHAPLAADIAGVSADLLFGDEPALTTTDKPAQAQIEALEEQIGLANLLAEAAEIASGTGGVYLRAAWDTTVAPHALSQSYPQTHAAPDFKYGRLVAVTLWEDVLVKGSETWRHLERHEKGVVYHGLYVGTSTELGNSVPLAAHPSTADLEPSVVLPGRLADRLLVRYIPNVLPNRKYPWKPIGRPDVAGCEDFLDAIDETWTSLMRDIRLGQAHIVVPEEWLAATGVRPGETKTLDLDAEAFTALNMADAPEQKMELFQPEIRVTQHIDTLLQLTERVVSAAGYSPQSFGLQIDGQAQSGTALRVRQGKTDKTVAKKQRYWTPEVAAHVQTLLDIGAEVFNLPTIADPVESPVAVVFPELEQDPVDKATWINTLRTARAMSIETGVRTAQPDLDEDKVLEEVARIMAEDGAGLADPTSVGRAPVPPTDPAGGTVTDPGADVEFGRPST